MQAELGSAVDWGQLRDVVLLGLAAGVGLPLAFALGLLGASRFGERRAQRRWGSALAYGLLTAFALAVFAAGVIAGIVAMTDKR